MRNAETQNAQRDREPTDISSATSASLRFNSEGGNGDHV